MASRPLNRKPQALRPLRNPEWNLKRILRESLKGVRKGTLTGTLEGTLPQRLLSEA